MIGRDRNDRDDLAEVAEARDAFDQRVAAARLRPGELAVVLSLGSLIARWTRLWDDLTLSQIEAASNQSRSTVTRALRKAFKRGLIWYQPGLGSRPSRISIDAIPRVDVTPTRGHVASVTLPPRRRNVSSPLGVRASECGSHEVLYKHRSQGVAPRARAEHARDAQRQHRNAAAALAGGLVKAWDRAVEGSREERERFIPRLEAHWGVSEAQIEAARKRAADDAAALAANHGQLGGVHDDDAPMLDDQPQGYACEAPLIERGAP